ncbi:MAG: bifunctional (p)ppGpp synthetase/guanosine-3',5'-bis(diphosphate) 3'-pyrophosphohydrolase [Bacillota bacterium]|nr:bifunctional (p)ppGpp synthetase/guanosine-3',5'-bis(diphosphate) 3'-pyrophosphohydrolase [Bacillota bacterium]
MSLVEETPLPPNRQRQLAELGSKLRETGPEPLSLLEAAFRFSLEVHTGQSRESGDEYFVHPCAVATILANLGTDVGAVCAGLLHDTVEDAGVSLPVIGQRFGPEISSLVDGVTKLSRIEYRSQEDAQVENLRKMFLAMARDLRVPVIKLADRLHNMRTVSALPLERQHNMARETIEVFAPLAHRLGIYQLKMELEDLSLRVLQPDVYRTLVERVAKKREAREADTQRVIETIRERLEQAGIEGEIQGRAKHFYSIYRKMYEQGKDISQIYDLIAIRIIVETVVDCYGVLGIVHSVWKPLPGRFKDYIAMPKANMYQSLHTTVVGPDGEPFEMQIRTRAMHRTAEYGIAAHWLYKEGARGDREFQAKLASLRRALEEGRDLADAQDYLEAIKVDLFGDKVYVFTPKGDVLDLPMGATPLDFAYAVHTEVGHRCSGAKVNGRIVPLNYHLRNGDMVEILTTRHGSPSLDWLSMAVSSGARSKIRSWFKRAKREDNVTRGRELLEKEARRQGFEPGVLLIPEFTRILLSTFGYAEEDDLYAAVGYGGLGAPGIIRRLMEEERRARRQAEKLATVAQLALPEPAAPARPSTGPPPFGVRVRGEPNMLVRFSRCCNPLPGDEIVGYITRGRGVSVHRAGCPNVTHHVQAERIIEVSWDRSHQDTFPVAVEVHALDRPGLFRDITNVIGDTRTNIQSATAGSDRQGHAVVEMVLAIRSQEHLRHLLQRISRVKDVYDVRRAAAENLHPVS